MSTESSGVFFGNQTKHSIVLPCTRVVVIRENNGDDESILSDVMEAMDGSNIPKYLINIIESVDGKPSPSLTELLDWPKNSIYYLLYRQRVLNMHGSTLVFKAADENPGHPRDEHDKPVQDSFEEDIKIFDYDGASSYRIKKYPKSKDSQVEHLLSDGTKFRFKILTYGMEQISNKNQTMNKNSLIMDRHSEYQDQNGNWTLITSLKPFNTKQTSDMRKIIQENDPIFNPCIEYTCPHDKYKGVLPLFQIPTFYFPEEATLM